MTPTRSPASSLPPELLDSIFLSHYLELQPRASLDAQISLARTSGHVQMTGSPVFARSLRNQAIHDFYRFCLVCKAWAIAAQPYLFRHIRVETPRQWESLLEVIAEKEEESDIDEERAGRSKAVHELRRRARSPPQSRQGSRSRSRSRARSPDRGDHRAHSIEARLHSVELERRVSEDELLRPPVEASDRLPGLHIESINFSSFRTAGLRRTIREGNMHRFVTLDKVLRLLQGTRSVGLLSTEGELVDPYLEEDEDPNNERGHLRAVGFTEYMDSALQKEVLDELLLRGGVEVDTRDGLKLTGSPAALAACPLVALDLCGCVSSRFVEGLAAFVEENRLGQGSGHRFPHLRRLGLFSVHIESSLLEAFVLSFPDLTHLDLTNTRATDALLVGLNLMAPRLQLRSLSLARCKQLTGAGLRDLFMGEMRLSGLSPSSCEVLEELSLYGDESAACALTDDDLRLVLGYAKCFTAGNLRYLDLGSAHMTDEHLSLMSTQTSLLDLGLGNMWLSLSMEAITQFLAQRAPNVQILDMSWTCMPHRSGAHVSVMDLHQRLIADGPSSLRVIELDANTLKVIAGGAGSWKIVRGKGRRGYYVNLKAQSQEMEAALKEIVRDERLTPADLGWHPRKMEILSGNGFMGRDEAGLFAFHALQ